MAIAHGFIQLFLEKTFQPHFCLLDKHTKIVYFCALFRFDMAEQILQIENVDPKELHGPNDRLLDLVKMVISQASSMERQERALSSQKLMK